MSRLTTHDRVGFFCWGLFVVGSVVAFLCCWSYYYAPKYDSVTSRVQTWCTRYNQTFSVDSHGEKRVVDYYEFFVGELRYTDTREHAVEDYYYSLGPALTCYWGREGLSFHDEYRALMNPRAVIGTVGVITGWIVLATLLPLIEGSYSYCRYGDCFAVLEGRQEEIKARQAKIREAGVQNRNSESLSPCPSKEPAVVIIISTPNLPSSTPPGGLPFL